MKFEIEKDRHEEGYRLSGSTNGKHWTVIRPCSLDDLMDLRDQLTDLVEEVCRRNAAEFAERGKSGETEGGPYDDFLDSPTPSMMHRGEPD